MGKFDKIPVVREIKHILAHEAARYFISACLVEGKLKGTDHTFRCLFAGKSYFTKRLEDQMYAEPPKVLWKRRLYIPALKARIQSNPDSADLIVAVVPRQYDNSFNGLYTYKGTELVRQMISTVGTWDEVRQQFSVRKRRTSNHIEDRYGLRNRVSKDIKDLDFFYHRMYIPHVRKRHGDFAQIDPYEEIRGYFNMGMLMFATKDGVDLGGNLCNVEDGILYLRRVGVLDGDESLIESGLQAAIYHFAIKYANENHLKAADAMMSLPFLNDGVYNTKKEWGAAVSPSDDYHTWVYFIHKGPQEKLAHFYARNPFVTIVGDGMKGIVGKPEGVLDSEFEETLNRYRSRGLNGFIVYTPNETLELP